MNDLPKIPRREPMQLQLTAMIDIFSMIVIFLILGSVFGGTELILPPGFTLPASYSKESVESAPQLYISSTEAHFAPLDLRIEAGKFGDPESEATKAHAKAIGAYVAGLPQAQVSSGLLLNVIADKAVPYRDIFNIVRTYRAAGFQTVLFVTTGKSTSGAPP